MRLMAKPAFSWICLPLAAVALAVGVTETTTVPAPARASVPAVHGCPRPFSYDRGSLSLQGGIYNFGHMSCSTARSVARNFFEGRPTNGFRCGTVAPNRNEPEGAERCRRGKAFVVFGSE